MIWNSYTFRVEYGFMDSLKWNIGFQKIVSLSKKVIKKVIMNCKGKIQSVPMSTRFI